MSVTCISANRTHSDVARFISTILTLAGSCFKGDLLCFFEAEAENSAVLTGYKVNDSGSGVCELTRPEKTGYSGGRALKRQELEPVHLNLFWS